MLMSSQQGTYVTQTRTVTKTVTKSKTLGYEQISRCRPKFVFFEFTGLRPNTPHWIFFDYQNVTRWVNTSYTFETYKSAPKKSDWRQPGNKFIKATAFPAQKGGPTSINGPLYTNSQGTLEGVFYLQSNEQTNFPTGKVLLTAIDISQLNYNNCLSFADGEYTAIGQYKLFYKYKKKIKVQEEYKVWVPAPPVIPRPVLPGTGTPSFGSSSSSDKDPSPVVSVRSTDPKTGQTTYTNSYSFSDTKSMTKVTEAMNRPGSVTKVW